MKLFVNIIHMGNFFYFIGYILFLMNIGVLTQYLAFSKSSEWIFKFQKVTKRKPNNGELSEKGLGNFDHVYLILTLTFFWIFLGIMTKSWIIFIILLFFNIIINLTIKHIGRFNTLSKILEFFKILISTLIIGLLVINHFHLHLDLYKVILNWI